MTKKKLAVIVPCYNTEKYLPSFFKKIDCQTLKDFEVLFIDDGSKDQTLSLIKNYCKKKKNCKVLENKKNQGAGFSRNRAIEETKAEYIAFLDADDSFPDNYLEKLLQKICDEKSDLVVCDMIAQYDSSFNGRADEYNKMFPKNKVSKLKLLDNTMVASPTNKLFKKELLLKNPFAEGIVNEDIPAIIGCILDAEKISYVPNVAYIYIQHNGSVQNSSLSPKKLDVFKAMDLLYERKKGNALLEEATEFLVFHQILLMFFFCICQEANYWTRKKYMKQFYELASKYPLRNNKRYWQFILSCPIVLKLYYKAVLKTTCLKQYWLSSLMVSSYRIYKKLKQIPRKILRLLFPLHSKRRKVLSKIKHIFIKKFKTFKKFLRKVFKRKGKLRAIFDDAIFYDKYQQKSYPIQRLQSIHKKIAVHLHLYYTDLLDEFITYLNYIPYSFDLYVSIMNQEDQEEILTRLKEIKCVNKVVVRTTHNSGRDYGPMMVLFGKELAKYDYVGHIHTKKSLRTGTSQDVWRTHLLDGMLGSKALLERIFYLFEEYSVGYIYPDSVDSFLTPYWGHAWLEALALGRQVCNELKIPFQDRYLDFSVGSMFWVKTEAVEQLFHKKWTWEDFGEEEGLNDGTLAYVFEKIFGICCQSNGYDFACYQPDKNLFYKNYSERNMSQYYQKSLDSMFLELKNYEVISFDIFDTLLTRSVYAPDDLFKLADSRIQQKMKLSKDFSQLRKEAEISLNQNLSFQEEPNIHQIYEEMKRIYHFQENEIQFMKETELSLEKEFLIPRKEMLALFNRLKAEKKTIILTSDMYLTSDILTDFLADCGFTGFERIYVSCEMNKRKDKGDIWEVIQKDYPHKSLIHVGDNEESDIHLAGDLDITSFHVMQGKQMLLNTTYGHYLSQTNFHGSTINSILYGLITNKKLFNSPFKFHKNQNEYLIENLNEFGYSIVGPILLHYLLWVLKSKELREKNTSLLFVAREGYYLEKLYQYLEDHLAVSKVEKNYFLTSRRCVTVATIHTWEDIQKILDIEYFGNMKDFMYYRFHVDYQDKNFKVCLSKDDLKHSNRKEVEQAVKNYESAILEEAEKERKNYLSYIQKTIPNLDQKNLIVLDLGYSGTTQVYLSHLLNKKIAGKYFVVTNKPKPLAIGCKVESCFNELENDNRHFLYLNSLFLECFLSAPFGQLMYFDEAQHPVYAPEKLVLEKKNSLDEIYQGVLELFEDMVRLCKNQLLSDDLDKDALLAMYQAFLLESKHFIEENKLVFTFEDYYCRSDEIVIHKQ